MPYRTCIALRYAVRDGAVACDEAMRNARPTMIAGARAATGVGMGGMGLEAVYAVAVSAARPGVEGMKAATTKTTSRMKATATMETATATMETATATVETATATVETAATTVETATTTMETAATTTTTMETAATTASAMARLRYVCERQPHDCAREDPSERQPNLFAAPSSQHIFLHPNQRRLGRPAAPEAS
jgi:CCR4-NOT transcriptional regulation complex NOT5 subunit